MAIEDDEVVPVSNPFGKRLPPNIRITIERLDDHWETLEFPTRCAVRIPEFHAVNFLIDLPDDTEGLEIEGDAWVEIASNALAWPEGAQRPEVVLCRSREDPKHCKIYKYHDEVDETEWEEVGLDFGGTFSTDQWRRFVEKLPAIRSLGHPRRRGDLTRAPHHRPRLRAVRDRLRQPEKARRRADLQVDGPGPGRRPDPDHPARDRRL